MAEGAHVQVYFVDLLPMLHPWTDDPVLVNAGWVHFFVEEVEGVVGVLEHVREIKGGAPCVVCHCGAGSIPAPSKVT